MKRWADVVSSAGAVLLSILSCAFCPLCIPLYAGILGFIGIEVGNLQSFMLPLAAIFSLSSLGFMAYQIHTHHSKWSPFILGFFAMIGMISSAFYDLDIPLYLSLAFFMGSVFWNKRLLTHGHGCC